MKAMALIFYYKIMLHFKCKLTKINYVDKNIKKCYYKYDDICELYDKYQYSVLYIFNTSLWK